MTLATPIPLEEESPKRDPRFSDLTPYLNGTHKQEVPTIADVGNGICLFYRGRINEIHGEPSAGKTNVVIASAIAILEAGGSVLYIDPEDTPQGFVSRCLALGADPQALGERMFYMHNPTTEDFTDSQFWAEEHKPDMVVLDGLAESLAAEGRDENSVADILSFFRERVRPFAEAGSAVVLADHVTKSTEGRGRWARGSGAKLGRYDGVSYSVELGQAYTPEIAGFVRLRISKDRNGGAGPAEKVVAEMHLEPGQGGMTLVDFRLPAEKGDFRPSAIMEKITKHLTLYTEANKRDLRSLGKSQYVDNAIELMIEEGTLTVASIGQRKVFTIPKGTNE